jgi:peptidoglycan pentaglycine glycine transferase (the first glycine)
MPLARRGLQQGRRLLKTAAGRLQPLIRKLRPGN